MSKSRSTLISQREQLEQRLLAGDEQIRLGRVNGVDTSRWETGWIKLLRDYERLCRQIDLDGSEALAA